MGRVYGQCPKRQVIPARPVGEAFANLIASLVYAPARFRSATASSPAPFRQQKRNPVPQTAKPARRGFLLVHPPGLEPGTH